MVEDIVIKIEEEIDKIFDELFEDFLKEAEEIDTRTLLQKLYIRHPRYYWTSENRKQIARLFFKKGLRIGRMAR